MPPTTAQMLAARQRRIQRFDARVEWLGEQVQRNIGLGMNQRLRLAAQLLRDKVVINISVPVTKERRRTRSGGSRTVVTQRSQPGEFPRADTTRLMKDIFFEVRRTSRGGTSAIVGTTLDYGLILETSARLDRGFLRRTMRDMQPQLARILGTGPPDMPGQVSSDFV